MNMTPTSENGRTSSNGGGHKKQIIKNPKTSVMSAATHSG